MKTKPAAKPIQLVVNLKPGPASLAQKQAWKRLWQKLIAECKRELKAQNESKG